VYGNVESALSLLENKSTDYEAYWTETEEYPWNWVDFWTRSWASLILTLYIYICVCVCVCVCARDKTVPLRKQDAHREE